MEVLIILLILIFAWQMKVKKEINEEYLSFNTCQAWKGFFALVIVYHHLELFGSFAKIGFLAVAVFFFFSGYGLQKKYIANNNYKNRYLITRIPTVLFPYIIMTAIYWAVYALGGKIYSIKDIFALIVNGTPIVSYSWYVINILVFYLVFYVLMKIAKSNYNLMILGTGLFYVLWVYLCRKSDFGVWWYMSTHLLIVGLMWATYEQKIITFIKSHYYTVLFITIFIFCACHVPCDKTNQFISLMRIDSIMNLIFAIVFTIIVLLFSLKIQIGNRILKFLGEISFEIYLSQGLFIKFFKNKNLNITDDLLRSALVLFSTIVFSFLLHKLFQFILSQYRKLIL